MNRDTKIEISMGAVEHLIDEVEMLRRRNEILSAEKRVWDNLFMLVDRLEGKPSETFGEDKLWRCKREFKDAIAAKATKGEECSS